MIVAVYVRETEQFAQLHGDLLRLAQIGALDDHDGAIGSTIADLHDRRYPWHHDHDRNSKLPTVIAQRLSVISGRRSYHALYLLVLIETQQRVSGAALLETARILEEIFLEIDFHVG